MQLTLCGGSAAFDPAFVSASPAAIRRQVSEYAAGERRTFDTDVQYPDDFLGDVMRAMVDIPYGETRTYGDLAATLDTSPVAVGGACGRNPVPIVVPCHRVVGANDLGGFSADGGVELKRALLSLESPASGEQRSLEQFG
ncbi:methylated-DNA--[protein]-cysteine S-methyltransferase [Haloferacaceae archaeon DSL9]